MSSTVLKAITLGVVCTLLEKRFVPDSPLGFLHETSATTLHLPRGFGITTFVLSFTVFWMVFYGFSAVGGARTKYRILAKKDGEKDAEQNYSYPNMYVTGSSSKHAKAFNCVQRSHQHIMETLPGYFFLAVVSAVSFPVATAILCALWQYSRVVWAAGYASGDGDAAKRYSHPFSKFHWTALLALFVMSLLSSVNIVTGNSFIWDVIL